MTSFKKNTTLFDHVIIWLYQRNHWSIYWYLVLHHHHHQRSRVLTVSRVQICRTGLEVNAPSLNVTWINRSRAAAPARLPSPRQHFLVAVSWPLTSQRITGSCCGDLWEAPSSRDTREKTETGEDDWSCRVLHLLLLTDTERLLLTGVIDRYWSIRDDRRTLPWRW